MKQEEKCQLKFGNTKCKGMVCSNQLKKDHYIMSCMYHASLYWRMYHLIESGIKINTIQKWTVKKIEKQFCILARKKVMEENENSKPSVIDVV